MIDTKELRELLATHKSPSLELGDYLKIFHAATDLLDEVERLRADPSTEWVRDLREENIRLRNHVRMAEYAASLSEDRALQNCALMSDNARLRLQLWLRHGCPIMALYGDDGEMQCNRCFLDFKRSTMDEIESRWNSQALAAILK